jgi:hypothetical protein
VLLLITAVKAQRSKRTRTRGPRRMIAHPSRGVAFPGLSKDDDLISPCDLQQHNGLRRRRHPSLA